MSNKDLMTLIERVDGSTFSDTISSIVSRLVLCSVCGPRLDCRGGREEVDDGVGGASGLSGAVEP